MTIYDVPETAHTLELWVGSHAKTEKPTCKQIIVLSTVDLFIHPINTYYAHTVYLTPTRQHARGYNRIVCLC